MGDPSVVPPPMLSMRFSRFYKDNVLQSTIVSGALGLIFGGVGRTYFEYKRLLVAMDVKPFSYSTIFRSAARSCAAFSFYGFLRPSIYNKTGSDSIASVSSSVILGAIPCLMSSTLNSRTKSLLASVLRAPPATIPTHLSVTLASVSCLLTVGLGDFVYHKFIYRR